ncbi:HAD family hydrolase [Streptomyces griseus]|uniref:HAD family hydrolase n=1 Tax=Streptomyces griseus TaxID=1911 RepID=UPI00099D347A|nr:HAD-IA family hydrolase [Streptomyces griseus]
MTAETENENERLRQLITRARVVLWDFDGPICNLFAGHPAEQVANDLVDWLGGRGLHGLLTDAERQALDPQTVLRALHRRHRHSDLVAEAGERLTQAELKAAVSARPTAYADPLIRTWTAVGSRLAITTNNHPRAVVAYLDSRGTTSCFAPHVYGRTEDPHLLKPDPDCLNRALNAMGCEPSAALMIGDAPTDFVAAAQAGVPFLGYARNERKAKPLRDAGAQCLVDSLLPVLESVRTGRS